MKRADGRTLARLDYQHMTVRARVYLSIGALRHGGVGWFCLFAPHYMNSPTFETIKDVAPLQVWGAMFVAIAITCMTAAVRGSENVARAGLVSSAAVTAMWAGGFLTALIVSSPDEPAAPTSFISWLALAGKDIITCRQPLRGAFEPVISRVMGEQDGRRR